MGDPTKAASALGSDVPRSQVDEWFDKASRSLDSGQMTKVSEMVADLTSKPLGNRIAVAYLKSVTAKPERVGRETLKDCRCDGGWFLEDDLYARACETCRPILHDRQTSPAVSDPVFGVRNHLDHQTRTTIHEGSDRWGCEVCRGKHGVKEPLSSASSWA